MKHQTANNKDKRKKEVLNRIEEEEHRRKYTNKDGSR
jgi:hypothetical protein